MNSFRTSVNLSVWLCLILIHSSCGPGKCESGIPDYNAPPFPNDYCALRIHFSYPLSIQEIYYPQVNQRIGATEHSKLTKYYDVSLLNGFDTTTIITRYNMGDIDTTYIYANKVAVYDECDEGWRLRHSNVNIVKTTIDSFEFSYNHRNFINFNILKP